MSPPITYAVYFDYGQGPKDFEPILCRGELEAMRRARELGVQKTGCRAVEVHFGDNVLFHVSLDN